MDICINDFAKEIHELAIEKGWWDDPRSFGDIIALCHSELSEALEEFRSGRPMLYAVDCVTKEICLPDRFIENDKPEGIAVEMADCIIRILDWCGKENVDIESILRMKHEYNKTRPHRHGGKVL